jgi:uncharacterized zinc-type alcohol dehydrogenase-like protein
MWLRHPRRRSIPAARVPAKSSAVAGIGGAGHMAIKLAKASVGKVVVLTALAGKAEDARRLGSDETLVATDLAATAAGRETLDPLLDTVSTKHDLNAYLSLVKRQGETVMLGTPNQHSCAAVALVFWQKHLSGSLVGGLHETQELLDFCGKHGITADVELTPFAKVDEPCARMVDADFRYRL